MQKLHTLNKLLCPVSISGNWQAVHDIFVNIALLTWAGHDPSVVTTWLRHACQTHLKGGRGESIVFRKGDNQVAFDPLPSFFSVVWWGADSTWCGCELSKKKLANLLTFSEFSDRLAQETRRVPCHSRKQGGQHQGNSFESWGLAIYARVCVFLYMLPQSYRSTPLRKQILWLKS